MQNYSIALSGLDVAQKALDTIGNNIANAATDGYHRQRINLTPAYSSQVGSVLLGGGVNVAGITRLIDTLLEQEILHQQSSSQQISQELITLQTIENTFGELSAGSSLSVIIDEFFNALQDLSAHPSQIIWQNQAVTAGQNLAGQFRTLGEFLARLETQMALEAENTIERINTLINQIAELNSNIERIQVSGGQTNNLQDQRDQRITELSELIGIQTQQRQYGVVDISIAGIPVVIGPTGTELEMGLNEGKFLGISAAGAHNYNTNVQGGRLGGLLLLKNELIYGIVSDLNALARTIIQQVNQYHVQGVGSEGSFGELTGWRMTSENLADFEPPVNDGKIYIRVTNTSTGQISRHEININVSTDSLSTIAAAITAITGLSASVNSSKLHIQADTNYTFDFAPAVLPTPTASNLTSTSPPTISVSGIYNGSENQTFTFTVIGSGQVGNGSLQLEVKNGAGEVVTTLNIGAGYAAGDKLDIGNGIKISLSSGDLNAADSFQVEAFANTDTSGVLAAVGINTFFSGSSATDMAVCSDLLNSPGRIATALGPELNDNANTLRLVGLRDQAISSLNGMTPGEFYHRLIANLGQQISIKQMRADNLEIMVQNLANKRSEISGVNINDEAAQILVFEQMFQAVAKYLTTVQSSIRTIMEII
ncbi:MAG: flagellar hook-associated protein FlgK [Sedimentisphaerales bacterium]